MEEPF